MNYKEAAFVAAFFYALQHLKRPGMSSGLQIHTGVSQTAFVKGPSTRTSL